MIPMAIPFLGGMLVVLNSVFVVPVLYCGIKELRFNYPCWGEKRVYLRQKIIRRIP